MQARGDPEDFERALVKGLYRFDCPDAHTLGEYQIGALAPPETMRVAGHAAECDECQADLRLLRSYLAAEIDVPETLVDRARRIVATLFHPSPGLAYSGVRGTSDATTRTYQAGDVTVTLSSGQRRGSLVGLVVASAYTPDSLDGRSVRLIPRDGAPIETTVDDLGNFEIDDAPSGSYVLEIELPDGIVVIEELQVD